MTDTLQNNTQLPPDAGLRQLNEQPLSVGTLALSGLAAVGGQRIADTAAAAMFKKEAEHIAIKEAAVGAGFWESLKHNSKSLFDGKNWKTTLLNIAGVLIGGMGVGMLARGSEQRGYVAGHQDGTVQGTTSTEASVLDALQAQKNRVSSVSHQGLLAASPEKQIQ